MLGDRVENEGVEEANGEGVCESNWEAQSLGKEGASDGETLEDQPMEEESGLLDEDELELEEELLLCEDVLQGFTENIKHPYFLFLIYYT